MGVGKHSLVRETGRWVKLPWAGQCELLCVGLMSPCLPYTGVAMMKFKSPPVNSLSLEFLTEFSISLEKLENDRACRGVIFTSVSVCSCLGHWSPAREGPQAPWIGSGRRAGGSWKDHDPYSVPFSSRRMTTKCCPLS